MKKAHAFLAAWLLAGIAGLTAAPVFFPAYGAGPKGTVYSFSVPKPSATPANAIYYCWLPESVGTVRCVIVHQHGCTRGGDAQIMMNDVQWLSLAKKEHAVFIAPDWPGGDCTWRQVNSGSVVAFLMALDTLAKRSSHPEIKWVPWALWGHSGGCQWITEMARTYASRIAVMIAEAGSQEMSTYPATLKIPILDHNSIKDMTIYFNNGAVFANGRALGAVWAHMINPYPLWVTAPTAYDPNMEGHAPHDLRMLAIPWMDICLASRLPDKAGDSVCKAMDTTHAWLGDTATHVIAPASQFTGNKLLASWLPNAFFALKWAEYMVKGTIYDSTPPPAPYNLTGTYANKQITLKWDADADLETGIKTFIIYRNGSLLKKMDWPNAPTTLFTFEKGYQRWEDGDQPDPSPAPNMTFTDANVSDTGTYVYQVSTVNWSDVAGPKSAPIALTRGLVTGVKTFSRPAAAAAPHMSISLCSTMGKRALGLMPGIVDVYDIRGRLVTTLKVQSQSRTSIEGLLGVSTGVSTEKILIVRNHAP
jgi:pimeloyl-ACP methyl ester carboxylesterase